MTSLFLGQQMLLLASLITTTAMRQCSNGVFRRTRQCRLHVECVGTVGQLHTSQHLGDVRGTFDKNTRYITNKRTPHFRRYLLTTLTMPGALFPTSAPTRYSHSRIQVFW
ncbi:unnamed protein product [Ectocarpus sp. 13 AM-2016]